jgi:Helitron helicase-like domain at N-terminus
MENFIPTLVDHSKEVSSVNQNLESEELFSCYYPDGTVNPRQGGFNNVNNFKAFINDLHATGFNMELKTNLTKKFLNGSNGDQLISSSLLQFPYGIGGVDEHRELPNGTLTKKAHLEGMMSHLSLVCQNCFQQPLFQLVLYSFVSKLKLLRQSRFQLRDERTVSALANGLDLNSLRSTIRGRQTGNRYAGTHASQLLLSAVDSMSRGLPHSNEAAKLVRKQGQSMQHTFGTPSLFLTATFDDENSLMMQVMSGDHIDLNLNPSSMCDSELKDADVKRKDLRLNYPGLGALNFEMLLEVVLEHVIGWNMHDHEATESPGLFGKCLALAAAMEEQGQKTVHVHFSISIDGFTKLRSDLFFEERLEKRLAEKLIPEYLEHISTTSLIGSGSNCKTVLSKAFDHDKCTKALHDRNLPVVVNAQGLRNLRHRMGYKEDSRFAWCDVCAQGFTYEDLVGLYSQRVGQISPPIGLVTPESCGKIEMSKARMHFNCVEFQGKKNAPATDVPSLSVNAAYNLHTSSHVSGCFKCQKKRKRSHVCGTSRDCECRYRMPDCPRKKACICDVNNSNLWFDWTCDEKIQPIIEVLPKRHTYNLFQNVFVQGHFRIEADLQLQRFHYN